MASTTLGLLSSLQSKKVWPAPFECAVWQAPMGQHPGVAHSQPSVSGAMPALQSVSPALHLYEHVAPLQLAGPVFVLHFAPHPPQLVVDESDDSHPLVSPPLVSQLAKPVWHPEYVQFMPEHVAPVLFTVSHARPHWPQFAAVVTSVSQPFVSGAVELQSA